MSLNTIILSFFFHEGINVTEIAHDIHAPVTSYITKQLGLINSYDTWHGEVQYCIPFDGMCDNITCRYKKCSERIEQSY